MDRSRLLLAATLNLCLPKLVKEGLMIMGIIAFDLVVLGVAFVVIKAEWLVPIRKYMMLIFLTSGIGLGAVAAWEIDKSLSIFLGIFASLCLLILIWVVLAKNNNTVQILHIPKDGYKIVAEDRQGAPVVQMRYFLFYENYYYPISTLPPAGNPPLILYLKRNNKTNTIICDIAIDTSSEALSAREKLRRFYGVVILMVALALPIVFTVSQDVLGGLIAILVGYGGRCTMNGSKSLLTRLIYWFSVLLEVVGWLSIPILLM